MTEIIPEKHEFQAEVQQVLSLVIDSLYTDKEIFLRELVSNAADSLEKLRHIRLTETDVFDANLPLEIDISTDENGGRIVIQDYGIGLTRQELVENLGTIAHSGSKAFMQALKNAREAVQDKAPEAVQLIGQFGVGFYAAFMVAKKVEVFTHSWKSAEEHLAWRSEGAGTYEIEPSVGERRGARIVLSLKDECKEFARESTVRDLLRKYSSFVQYPIKLNGTLVNTVQAIWMRSKAEIKPEEYTEFYRFQADAFDEPRYTLHFSADAPLAINALIFTPESNFERLGMGRMEPGVALYCKRVMIAPHPDKLLPEWLRFLRGVIDSADLPLNISRESMQDSALVKKLSNVVVGRYLKFLAEQATKEPEKYVKFWKEFGIFIKEGIVMEPAQHEKLSKLLRYESSLLKAGELTSFADYVSRLKPNQDTIYYMYGSSRPSVEAGPYLETFKAAGIEVMFLYEPSDEFVMNHLAEFDGKKLLSADSADLKLDDVTAAAAGEALPQERMDGLCKWVKETLGERVREVLPSKRLTDSPAAATNADRMMTPSMRRLMRLMKEREGNEGGAPEVQPVNFELNPKSALVARLDKMRESDPETASDVVRQLFDNAMMAAGFLENPQEMVKRINKLLEKVQGK
jgi:TNF receptor-associated protein 1